MAQYKACGGEMDNGGLEIRSSRFAGVLYSLCFLIIFSLMVLTYVSTVIDADLKRKLVGSVLFLIITAFFLVKLYSLHRTRLMITKEYIEIVSLFRTRRVLWNKVVACWLVLDARLILQLSVGKDFTLLMWEFSNPESVLREVASHTKGIQIADMFFMKSRKLFYVIIISLVFSILLMISSSLLFWGSGVAIGITFGIFIWLFEKGSFELQMKRWIILLIPLLTICIVVGSELNGSRNNSIWDTSKVSLLVGAFFGFCVTQYLLRCIIRRKSS